MNEHRRTTPTTNVTLIHTGASAVSTTQSKKYVETVMIRRQIGDTEVECENARACTNAERRRPSVGRIALRFRRALSMCGGYGEATIEAINASNPAALSATVAFGPMNLT